MKKDNICSIADRTQEHILGNMVSLACGDMPEGYVDNGQKLWKAFNLGREFERKEKNKQ